MIAGRKFIQCIVIKNDNGSDNNNENNFIAFKLHWHSVYKSNTISNEYSFFHWLRKQI